MTTCGRGPKAVPGLHHPVGSDSRVQPGRGRMQVRVLPPALSCGRGGSTRLVVGGAGARLDASRGFGPRVEGVPATARLLPTWWL